MLFGQACFAAEVSSASCTSSHSEESERTVLLQRSPATNALSAGVMRSSGSDLPIACYEDVKLHIINAWFHEQLSETGKHAVETSDEYGPWQRFTLEHNDDGSNEVFIVSPDGKYLSDDQGKLKLKEKGEAWETWKITDAGDGKVFLTSHRNQHLADKNGQIYMSPKKGAWEEWRVKTMTLGNMCQNKTKPEAWYTKMEAEKLKKVSNSIGSTAGQDFTVASYNVYYNNHDYKAQAKLILDTLKSSIVNIQEAIKDMPARLVEQLNQQTSEGSWALANKWSPNHYWCGLTTYRSDIWDLQDNWEVGVKQTWDTRGVCGSLLQRKSDGLKLCVWGTHPIWKSASSWWGRHAIQNAAWAIKECSNKGGRSLFMGDLNTHDTEAIRKELNSKTGLSWKLAFGSGYDQIYTEMAPNEVGETSKGTCVSPQGGRGCGMRCRNNNWGRSDHPPVFVRIAPGQ